MLLTFGINAYAFECVGVKKYTKNRESKTVMAKLEKIDSNLFDKVHVDIEDAYYSFRKNDEDDYTAFITYGPDYLKGNTMTGSFNSKNEMRFSNVEGTTVYTLKCIR